MANVTIKHEKELAKLNDEVKNLNSIIKEMGNKMNSMMEKDMNISGVQKEIEVIAELQAEEPKEPTEMSEEKEVKDKEPWIYCQICKCKRKTNKNMLKHMNEKHKEASCCNICNKICSSVENIARIAKRCPENIASVVKCVQLFSPKVLRKYWESAEKVLRKC